MSEEMAKEIVEHFKSYKADLNIMAILFACCLVVLILDGIFFAIKCKKIKQWQQEYYATLNDEQRKALDNQRKINKCPF